MEAIPLFITTICLIGGLTYMLVASDIEEIKQKWEKRRCEVPIMFSAYLFKPDGFKGTSSEFATENMNFCTRQIAKGLLLTLLGPVQALLGNQLDVLNVLGSSLNMMRTMLSNATKSFSKLLDPLYRRFTMIGGHFRIVMQQFLSSMNRVVGIAISQLFVGITAVIGMQNIISFVIKVVMIIMGIIIAIFILLFFVLIPFLPMILTVIGVLASVGLTVGGTEVFCFLPNSPVILFNGLDKPISQVNLGDTLSDGGVIKGILLTTRDTQIPIYNYNGIFVSGSHLVFENKMWKTILNSEKAYPVIHTGGRLYSLRTSTRNIFMRGTNKSIVQFRDWEEIAEGDSETDANWDYLVQTILNNTRINTDTSVCDPLFSFDTLVCKGDKLVPMGTIQIGDEISMNNHHTTKTRVLGVYKGRTDGIQKDTNVNTKWFTDGVWWFESGNWVHRQSSEPKQLGFAESVSAKDSELLGMLHTAVPQYVHKEQSNIIVHIQEKEGIHLITEAGLFWVHAGTHSGIVRDFTEVGIENLELTTDFILRGLNEQNIPLKKKECV